MAFLHCDFHYHKVLRCLLVSCLMLNTPMSWADEDESEEEEEVWPPQVGDRGIGLYMDQDLFFPVSNEDRDYTMGIAVEFFWQVRGLYPLSGLAKQAGEWFGLHDADDEIVQSFMIGSVNFTPDDLSDPDPITNDRPYASLLYLSNKRVRASIESAVGVELRAGILGADVGAKTQEELHRLWRKLADSDEPVDPQGWDHQISDGGELTLRLRLSNARLRYEDNGRWDVASSWGLSLGYQTNGEMGIAARVGKIASPFWTLPHDPVNRGSFLPSTATNEWYFWASYRLRLVAYDALLQGQFRDSRVSYRHDEIENVLHEGAAGLTVGLDPMQISLSLNAKTAELRDAGRNHHVWGSLNFILRF